MTYQNFLFYPESYNLSSFESRTSKCVSHSPLSYSLSSSVGSLFQVAMAFPHDYLKHGISEKLNMVVRGLSLFVNRVSWEQAEVTKRNPTYVKEPNNFCTCQ